MAIPLLLVVSATAFLIQSLIPGDIASVIGGIDATPEEVVEIRKKLGLDQPVILQYLNWLLSAVQGDLGTSLANGEPVASVLATRLPVTISLVGLATLTSLTVGVLLGLLSSWGPKRLGRLVDVISIVGLAAPGFWIALILISTFAVQLRLFPPGGYVPASESLSGWLIALVLPVVAVSASGLTAIAKQTREAMLDVSSRDFIRNLRANGISPRSILLRHALRNAAIPVVTITGLIFIGSLTGAVVIEIIFGLPGLGTLAVNSTMTQDIPLIQGVAVSFTLLVVVVNLIVDIVYGLINPKVRVS
jgi:peptide/nickel transport system permease protein